MRFLLLAWLLFAVAVTSAAASEDDFLAARDAFRRGDAKQLQRLADNFRDSLLEPYLTYYQLKLNLQTADTAAIRSFLHRKPEDTPLIDKLRGEWLKQLGKNGQWDDFDREYPHLKHHDTELTCYELQSRRRTHEQAALQAARKLWFSGDGQPESCSVLFEAALAAGVIDEQDVWRRLRLALESGNVSLAKQLAARLPKKEAPGALSLSRAYNDPERYLARAHFRKASRGQREVALFALQRLAIQLPELAYRRWRKIVSHFSVPEQHYFYAWLGYEAARDHNPHALAWYRKAANERLDSQQLAWRVRAALRAKNWREVLRGVNAMPPQQGQRDAWRYWKARALQALGYRKPALAIFFALSGEYSFYGQLAAEELGSAPGAAMTSADYQPTQAEIAQVASKPGIRRAEMLYSMDMRTDALQEWSWAIRNFDDKHLLAAAELARRDGIYDRAIGTAERTERLHDFKLSYLAPYRAELEPRLRENKLDEAWVYGLMRQESRFVTQAKSGAGAAGLMQIMPATARWVARKMGMRDYRHALIHELETNLKLGTYYLKTVLSRFDNNPVLASTAYNAGPTRAQQWRGDVPLEGAIYAETIPFDETRHYVKKVMSNTVYYAKLFGQPIESLKQRLGVIAPKDANAK